MNVKHIHIATLRCARAYAIRLTHYDPELVGKLTALDCFVMPVRATYLLCFFLQFI